MNALQKQLETKSAFISMVVYNASTNKSVSAKNPLKNKQNITKFFK